MTQEELLDRTFVLRFDVAVPEIEALPGWELFIKPNDDGSLVFYVLKKWEGILPAAALLKRHLAVFDMRAPGFSIHEISRLNRVLQEHVDRIYAEIPKEPAPTLKALKAERRDRKAAARATKKAAAERGAQ